MLTSNDINNTLNELHKRKTSQLKKLQHLEKLKEKVDNYAAQKKTLTDELSIINSQIKEFSVLYKNCIDIIMLDLFKQKYGTEEFNLIYSQAEREYKARK